MSATFEPNHYHILGVATDAEDVVIRAAYRALMQRYHPDKASPTEQAQLLERTLAIQKAYQVLSDPVQRRHYDQGLGKIANPFTPNLKDWEAKQHSFASAFGMPSLERVQAQSWEALLHCYPQLQAHYSRLLQSDPNIAQEYKNFLIEIVAERVVSKAIERVTTASIRAIDI